MPVNIGRYNTRQLEFLDKILGGNIQDAEESAVKILALQRQEKERRFLSSQSQQLSTILQGYAQARSRLGAAGKLYDPYIQSQLNEEFNMAVGQVQSNLYGFGTPTSINVANSLDRLTKDIKMQAPTQASLALQAAQGDAEKALELMRMKDDTSLTDWEFFLRTAGGDNVKAMRLRMDYDRNKAQMEKNPTWVLRGGKLIHAIPQEGDIPKDLLDDYKKLQDELAKTETNLNMLEQGQLTYPKGHEREGEVIEPQTMQKESLLGIDLFAPDTPVPNPVFEEIKRSLLEQKKRLSGAVQIYQSSFSPEILKTAEGGSPALPINTPQVTKPETQAPPASPASTKKQTGASGSWEPNVVGTVKPPKTPPPVNPLKADTSKSKISDDEILKMMTEQTGATDEERRKNLSRTTGMPSYLIGPK